MIPMSWIGWALLSAVFAAATALLAKVGVAHVDSNLATALRTSVVVVFAWGIALALGKHGEIRSLDRRTCCFSRSPAWPPASRGCATSAPCNWARPRACPLDKLSVPLVMVFAWLLLGEKLTPPPSSAACSSPPAPWSWCSPDRPAEPRGFLILKRNGTPKAPHDQAQIPTNPIQSTQPPRRIVLTGFMGSGKSTVGPLLPQRLGWTSSMWTT
jgi:bacterial/archaeal transporter family protein